MAPRADNAHAVLLTGGASNQVLRSHPQMCHHCGYLAGKVVACISGCGRRAHPECVAWEEGMCDACNEEGVLLTSCCVCEEETLPNVANVDDVSVTIPCVIYHGRTWRRVDDGEGGDAVVLAEDHWVSKALDDDPHHTFQTPSELPHGGAKAMRARTASGATFASVPFVVHSWCAASAFQQAVPRPPGARGATSAPPPVDRAWSLLLDGVRNPRRSCHAETGDQEKAGVRGGEDGGDNVRCAFCGGGRGFLVFCHHHTSDFSRGKPGCLSCRWDMKPCYTLHAFHPTCATRGGMRRYCDPGGRSGMLCATGASSKQSALTQRVRGSGKQRDHHVAKVCLWVQSCSGYHTSVIRAHAPHGKGHVGDVVPYPSPFEQSLPRLGALYSSSSPRKRPSSSPSSSSAREDARPPRRRADGGGRGEEGGDEHARGGGEHGDGAPRGKPAPHDAVDQLDDQLVNQLVNQLVRRAVGRAVDELRTEMRAYVNEQMDLLACDLNLQSMAWHDELMRSVREEHASQIRGLHAVAAASDADAPDAPDAPDARRDEIASFVHERFVQETEALRWHLMESLHRRR